MGNRELLAVVLTLPFLLCIHRRQKKLPYICSVPQQRRLWALSCPLPVLPEPLGGNSKSGRPRQHPAPKCCLLRCLFIPPLPRPLTMATFVQDRLLPWCSMIALPHPINTFGGPPCPQTTQICCSLFCLCLQHSLILLYIPSLSSSVNLIRLVWKLAGAPHPITSQLNGRGWIYNI